MFIVTLQGISLFDVDQQHGASFYVIPTEFIDEVLVLVPGNCICQYQNYQRGFLLPLLCCLLIQLGWFSSKKRHLERVYSTNSNDKFSNKQFISVDLELYEYILSNVREHEVHSFLLSLFVNLDYLLGRHCELLGLIECSRAWNDKSLDW